MEQKKIQSKRGTVYYWTNNIQDSDASSIVFTHGMIADHTMFNRQVEHFKEKYKLITWDVPLHGHSRPYEEFSYYNLAAELKSILDAEKINKVILVGHSMGGYICQEFSLHYPDKVSAFIAIDSTPFGHYYYTKLEKYILDKMSALSAWIPYKILIRSMAKKATNTEYAYENLYNAASKLSKREIIFIMRIVYKEFLKKEKTSQFNFPVLLIVGEDDTTGRIKKYNQKWAQHAGYLLKIIPNAGHNSHVDNPEDCNEIIRGFLNNSTRA